MIAAELFGQRRLNAGDGRQGPISASGAGGTAAPVMLQCFFKQASVVHYLSLHRQNKDRALDSRHPPAARSLPAPAGRGHGQEKLAPQPLRQDTANFPEHSRAYCQGKVTGGTECSHRGSYIRNRISLFETGGERRMPGRRQPGPGLGVCGYGLRSAAQAAAAGRPFLRPLGNLGSPEIFNDNRQVPDNIPPRVEHAFAHRYLYPVPGKRLLVQVAVRTAGLRNNQRDQPITGVSLRAHLVYHARSSLLQ